MRKCFPRESVERQDRSRRASQADRPARPEGRAHGDAARPASAFHARLAQLIDAVCQRGAGFKSLKDTWADTTSPHGRLMLTVLGGLAEFERELIRQRAARAASLRKQPPLAGPATAPRPEIPTGRA